MRWRTDPRRNKRGLRQSSKTMSSAASLAVYELNKFVTDISQAIDAVEKDERLL